MHEWSVVELGDVANVTTGFPFKSKTYTDDPVDPLLLRGDNVAQGFLRWTNARRWPAAQTEGLDEYWLRKGDVILAMDRPWIEAGLKYAAVTEDDLPSLLVQRVARLRGGRKLDVRFLKYVIGSQAFTNHVLGVQTGTAVPHISGKQVKAFRFNLPSLDFQQAIAEVLGSLDDKIELNRRMNATLEGMAQAIFRDWFVDFGPTRRKQDGADDPVQIMGGLVQDPARAQLLADLFPATFGDDGLPEGWSTLPVSEIANRVAMGPFGSRITKDNFISEGVPVIRGQNLKDGFLDDNFVFLTEEKAEELSSAAAKPESIVFTHRGTLGQVGRIPIEAKYPQYIVSQSQMLLEVDKTKVSNRLVYYFFKSDLGQDALLAHTNTTGVPSLGRPSTSLKGIRLAIPVTSISSAFDCYLEPIERQSLANLRQNDTLIATRDLLLPKLMSGEIRLRDAEKAVENAA